MLTKAPIWIRTMAITMLLAMVYYFAGYRFVYFSLLHQAKSNASTAIMQKNASFETITLTTAEYNELVWTDNGKEFNRRGQLFDLGTITKSGDKYILQVYADKNETGWTKALNDFVKELFPSDNSKETKDAEGFLFAFQQEYLPAGNLQLQIPYSVLFLKYSPDFIIPKGYFSSHTWHPPTVC